MSPQCTMQPSIAIWSKWDKIFFYWCKTINILQEKYFPHKYNKKCHFFYKKNVKGWTVKAEIFHEDKRGQSQKNISK